MRSLAIRKFIITQFLATKLPFKTFINHVQAKLKESFFVGEIVFVAKLQTYGRVIARRNNTYLISIFVNDSKGSREEVINAKFKEMDRDEEVKTELVKNFLIKVTSETPFGRVLKPNVVTDLKKEESAEGEAEEKEEEKSSDDIVEVVREENGDVKAEFEYSKGDFVRSDYSKNDYSKGDYIKSDYTKSDYSKSVYSKIDGNKSDLTSYVKKKSEKKIEKKVEKKLEKKDEKKVEKKVEKKTEVNEKKKKEGFTGIFFNGKLVGYFDKNIERVIDGNLDLKLDDKAKRRLVDKHRRKFEENFKRTEVKFDKTKRLFIKLITNSKEDKGFTPKKQKTMESTKKEAIKKKPFGKPIECFSNDKILQSKFLEIYFFIITFRKWFNLENLELKRFADEVRNEKFIGKDIGFLLGKFFEILNLEKKDCDNNYFISLFQVACMRDLLHTNFDDKSKIEDYEVNKIDINFDFDWPDDENKQKIFILNFIKTLKQIIDTSKFENVFTKNRDFDRLLFLKFIIDTICQTKTFNSYLNELIELIRQKEKTRSEFSGASRRLSTNLKSLSSEQLARQKEELRRLDKEMQICDIWLLQNRYKCYMGLFGLKEFFLIGEAVYYKEDGKWFILCVEMYEAVVRSVRLSGLKDGLVFGNLIKSLKVVTEEKGE